MIRPGRRQRLAQPVTRVHAPARTACLDLRPQRTPLRGNRTLRRSAASSPTSGQPAGPLRSHRGMRCLATTRAARVRYVALSAAGLMAVTGCATAIAPSAPHAAARPAAVAAARAASCSTSVLRLVGGREGENETAIGFIEFANTGSRPCALRGYPRLALIWHGRRLRVRDIPPEDLALTTVVLAPGKADAAQLMVSWSNWCGPRVAQLSVEITIPGTGRVTVPFNGPPEWYYTPQCVQPGQPSQLRVTGAYAGA
jgi:hypothetical protein